MSTSIDILNRIHAAYYQLTAAERKVSDYILSCPDQIQYMSISQVAEECGVADATISRFCRNLGLKGFHSFKLEIAKHVATVSTISTQSNLKPSKTKRNKNQRIGKTSQDAIQQTIDLVNPSDITKAVSLMEKASNVVCIGSGGSMIMAQECAHLFSMVCNKFFAVNDSHMQISCTATLNTNDTIILFSYSGATKNGIAALELAKSRGISTILVTRFPKSPAAELADVVLCCGSNESPFQFGSVPARVAQLVVMDVLFHEYVTRNKEQSDEALDRIGAALSNMHI